MRSASLILSVGLAIGGAALVGCDDNKTVEHKKTEHTTPSGTNVEKEKKVEVDKETGKTTVTEKKDVDKPDNNRVNP